MRVFTLHKRAAFFRSLFIVCTLLVTTLTTAFALDLETARAKGLIGEVDNGYIAIPPGAGIEARELVTTVNQQRKSVYTDIAAKNGITIEATGQRTFEKRYPEFPAGTWVQMKGTWLKK